MSCHNHCPGNYSSGSLRNICHSPVTSSSARCSTNVSCGDAICLPSTCQGSSWLLDNCQETCNEPTSCQPANCEPCNSGCPSTAYYVTRPCQRTSFLPVSSSISGAYLPVSCRPLGCVSSSYRPLRPLLYSSHPLGCAPVGYRPLDCLSNSHRPLSLLTYGCRPLGGLTCGSQPLSVVPSSLRPLRPLCSGSQPLAHVFNTCRPSCSALGY